MAARGRAATASFHAMHNVLEDAEPLVTRFGSLLAAGDHMKALERKNAELEAALTASSQRIADLETRAQLSPSKAVDILQRECTCVGDVGVLGTLLSESLHSSPSKKLARDASVRVILSVHQVNLGLSAPSDTTDIAAELEVPLEDLEAVEPVVAAKKRRGRPPKRQRRAKNLGDETQEATPQWTDRIQTRICALRSGVGGNELPDGISSPMQDQDADVDADASDSSELEIKRRDQIDTSPGSWAQLGVEVIISRLAEKALSWSPPYDLMDAIEERQRDPPALTIEAFAALDAARPWDLVYLQRWNESYTFDYHTLQPAAKTFVRAMRWFQFKYRRELWEWMHWIPMAKKTRRAVEWEAYRQGRDERSNEALEAWSDLRMNATKLVRNGLIPVDFFLDPSVWVMRHYQWLSWKPATADLVLEQADEDARHPARSFYVSLPDAHPFFSSPFGQLYTTAHPLPRITDVNGKLEVQIEQADDETKPCPTSWRTTELAPVFQIVPVGTRSSRGSVDVKPSARLDC